MKYSKASKMQHLLLAIMAAIIIEMILFTMWQMGFFSGEPEMKIQPQYTEESVPELRIATDYDFCPNAYFNSKGELSGLYIELMTELANRLEMNPVFMPGTWMECRENLSNGDADVLLGLEIFSNMQGTLRTIPISSDELCVYGKNEVSSAAALSGKKVALMARSVIISTFDLQCEYVEYNTNTEILQAVENGEADYGICHGAVAEKIIENSDLHLIKGVAIMKSFPALAVSDSNPKLQGELNAVLQDMAEDGTLYKLKTKWIDEFTKNHSLNYVLKDNQAFYIISDMSILLLLIISVVFRMYARSQEQHIEELLTYQKELEISNEKAERASRAKSEFLSHMSHDIRTPMNGIMGMSEMIRRNITDTQRVSACLDNIDTASSHLLSLINDVLDMSKLESGEIELEHVPFSIDDELKNIRAIIAGKVQEKRTNLVIHDDNLPHRFLIGSAGHFRRILINLLSNALKYSMTDGHVRVDISEQSCREHISVIEIKVQDDGIGMSRDFIEHNLYKPFTQENNTARTKYKGTGLGMAIVHELVDAMQGTIQVDSTPGKGTVFTVTLPFEIDEAPVIQKKKAHTDKDIRGMHILLAEDNALNREIAQCILEEAGAETDIAADGKQAVDMFCQSQEGSYDVILMDIMMPVMDGLEAARTIRSLARKDALQVAIIAMTANAFAEDRKKTADAGMNAHLAKPLNTEELLATLAQYR